MLTIRLQRTGTKNRPSFRLILAQAHRSASKNFLEVLGHYNPRSKEFGIKNEERLKYWIAQHVQLSPTVHNLLVSKKFIEAKKVKAWQPKKKETVEGEAAPAAPTATAAAAPAAEAESTPVTESPVADATAEPATPAEVPAPAETPAPTETPAEPTTPAPENPQA
jgi:small subunit ribosomal protein S16